MKDKLLADYEQATSTLPAGIERERFSRWLVKPPELLKKDGQRVFWSSNVIAENIAEARIGQFAFASVTPVGEIAAATTASSVVSGEVGTSQDVKRLFNRQLPLNASTGPFSTMLYQVADESASPNVPTLQIKQPKKRVMIA